MILPGKIAENSGVHSVGQEPGQSIENPLLSKQENRVVHLAMEGFGDKEIAARLEISLYTIRTYWDRIRATFGGITRSEVLTKMGRLDAEAVLQDVQKEVEALRESERQVREIADLLPQLVWVLRPDRSIALFNRRFLSYVGCSQEEAQAQGLNAFLHPEDENGLKEIGLDSNFEEFRVRMLQPDGFFRWHLVQVVPSLDDQNKLKYWLCTGTDIHESHLLTQELIMSQDRLKEAEKLGSLGIWDFIPTQESFWSDNMFRLMGMSPSSPVPSIEKFMSMVQPEFRSQLSAFHESMISNGETKSITFDVKREDGEIRTIFAKAAANITETGFLQVRGFNQDITDSIALEAKFEILAKSRQALLDSAAVGILLVDPSGNIKSVNRRLQDMLGYEEHDLIGQYSPEIFFEHTERERLALKLPGSEDMTPVERFRSMAKILASSKEPLRTRYLSKTGVPIPVRITLSSFLEDDAKASGYVIVVEDLTHIVQMEHDLIEQKKMLDGIFTALPGMIYLFDLVNQSNKFASGNLTHLLGYSAEEVQEMGDQLLPRIVHPDDMPGIASAREHLYRAKDGEVIEVVYRLRHKSGEYRWVMSRDQIFERRHNGAPLISFGVCLDVTEFKLAEMRLLAESVERAELAVQLEVQQYELELQKVDLAKLAATDGLTGIPNNRTFHEHLAAEIENPKGPLSLLFIDVDEFKSYNDEFGHPAGDLVLKQLAELMRLHLREEDFAARYGGEEFAIILPNTPQEVAVEFAEKLRETVAAKKFEMQKVTLSIGVALLKASEDKKSFLLRADRALYLSKAAGRDCVTLAKP